MRMVPEVGWCRFERSLTSEDFPLPFDPTMTTREEAGRSNETFRSAILFSEDPGYLNDTLLQVGVCQLVVVVEEEEEEEGQERKRGDEIVKGRGGYLRERGG